MNAVHGTLYGALPMLLSQASRKWMGEATKAMTMPLLLSTELSKLHISAPRSCQSDYSTSESSTIQRRSENQCCRAFTDSTFHKGIGVVSMKPGKSVFRILDPGSFSSMTPGLFGIYNVSSRSSSRGLKDVMILPKENVRGFAKTVSVPPQMQKPMKLRLFMGSPGIIGEPYKKPLPPLSILRRWLTKEGWKRRKESFIKKIKTAYTIAKLRQKSKGYSQQRFYQEASDLYKQINIALAEGERTTLRQLVTDKVFSGMKNELKHRETTWAKVTWEMVGPINKMRTMQGRLIAVDKSNQDNAFVQLTLRILSKQKFAAYDKRGKLIAGDPDKELLVEDYWVFEKPLLLTEAKWRLCGRLTV